MRSTERRLRPYRARCAQRKLELDDVLARLVAFAGRTPDIARVVVFGSYVRERISPWSDLDVLVVRDAGPPDLVDDLYRACGGAAITGMRSDDYPQRLASVPIGRDILAQGREVYARPAR